MAKYKEVANIIQERIKNGTYAVESKLPDQVSMAEEFSTSRVTIKKALDLLYVAGLVYTVQGSGTYVKKNAFQQSSSNIRIGQNVGLSFQTNEKVNLQSKVLYFNVRFPDEMERDQLLLRKESPVYEIKRLRILNDRPYSIEHTIIPVELVPNLTQEVLQKSVYQYIKEELGLVFDGNRQSVRAAQPNELDREYLNCSENEPVLEVIKVMFLETGTPFEYSKVRHRYDMVEMSFVNSKH